jgi:hypothetical protein
MQLYPEIGLVQENFKRQPKGYWQDVSNGKKVFDAVAASYAFDPLVPDNWYQFSMNDIANKRVCPFF